MPTSQPRLEKQLYETVLASVLKESVEMFSKLLKQWPVDLYRQETVLQLIEDSIDSANQSDNRLLLESAASLQVYLFINLL